MKPLEAFTPKSTALLERGHYWAIPLPSGGFGAGCVVGHRLTSVARKRHSRMFVAGVVAWRAPYPPTAEALAGRSVYRHGFAHIRAILEAGGAILGAADIDFGGLPSEVVEPCDSMITWGYGVPLIHASNIAPSHS
jgi:hypothetical protein